MILDCDVYQASVLNMILPQGYKLELQELVNKAMSQRQMQIKNSKVKPTKPEAFKK